MIAAGSWIGSVSGEIEYLGGEVARLNSRMNGLVAAIPRPAQCEFLESPEWNLGFAALEVIISA
jgi:hypothetical protein